jgi:hypothetical protein
LLEPAKDWRSDCLAKRNLVGVELCGVLGRLHSIEGLAQSNNNAKLKKSAKHDTTLLITSAEKERSDLGGWQSRWRKKNGGRRGA